VNVGLARNWLNGVLSLFKKSVFNSESRGFQSMILFAAWIGAMGLNFLGSILTTRLLGPDLYGDLKFIQTIWMLLSILSTIGLIQSGSRVLLLERDPALSKEAVGAVLTLALIMGILVGTVTAVIAYPADYLFHARVAPLMLGLAPLAIGFTLRDALILILQSTNQINVMAALEFFPSLLYVLALYSISRTTVISTGIALATQQVTLLVAALVVIVLVRPRFGSFQHYLRLIRKENATYGFPIYKGMIASTATSYVNRLSISYWVDNAGIGFFSLASTITEPFRLVPNAAGITSFRSFADQRHISKKILWPTIISSSVALLATWLFISPVLSWFYPKGFSSVGPMVKLLAVGAVAQGFGDLLNRFLGAHGQGVKLKNVAYLVGGVNILGLLFLTPFLKVNGVVITAILAGLSNMIFMFMTYKRLFGKSDDIQ